MPLSPDPYRRAQQEQSAAEAAVAAQQRSADRLAAAQAKQAASEQDAAAKSARKAELSRQELDYRAQGMIPVTTADGNLHPDPLWEQKQAEKTAKEQQEAQKDATAAQAAKLADQFAREGRKSFVSKVTGLPTALESDAQLEEQKKASAEKARRDALGERITATETASSDPAKRRLPATERKTLAKDLAKAKQDALFALQAQLQEQAKTVSGGNDWVPFNESPTPEATAAQERLARLSQPDAGLDDADLAALESNDATKPHVQKLRAIQAQLAQDDEAAKFHDQQAQTLFDLKLRRDDPAAWAERQRQRRASMTPEQLQADLQVSTTDLAAKGQALNESFAPIQARRDATRQKLDDLARQAAQRRAQGLTAGQIVSMTNPDGTTELWPSDLAAAYEKESAHGQEAEAQDAATLERIIAQRDDLLAEEVLHNEAATRLNEVTQATQAQQATTSRRRFQFTPGMENAAQELDALRAEAATRWQTLADQHPEGIPQEALDALHADVQARTEATVAAGEAKLQGAAQAAAQIRQRINAGEFQSSDPAPAYQDAAAQLAEANGIAPEEAQRLIFDAESATDWGSTYGRHNEGSKPGKTRLLSNGGIVVNPSITDKTAYEAAVAASGATPDAQADAIARYPQVREAAARQVLESIQEIGSVFGPSAVADYTAHAAKRPADLSEAEWAMRYIENEKANARSTTWNTLKSITREAWTSLNQGAIDLRQQASGLLGGITGSETLMGDAQWAGRKSAGLQQSKVLSGDQSTNVVASAAFSSVPRLAASILPAGLGAKAVQAGVRAFAGTGLGARLFPALAASIEGSASAAQAAKAVDSLTRAALGGAAAAGAAQTYGAQIADIYGTLRREHPDMSHTDALQQAQAPAIVSALATAALTTLGGSSGVERLFTRPQEARALFDKVFASRLQQAGFVGKEFLKGGLKESFLEELPDEMISQIAGAVGTGKPVQQAVAEFLQQLPELALATAAIGGAGQGIAAVRDSSVNPDAGKPEVLAPAWAAIENHIATGATGQPDPALTEQQQRRAALALSLAQGGELFDVEATDLAAAGWTRDGDKFKPIKGYTGPQVLDIDSGGLPVIKDSYIQALRDHGLAPVAAAIGMTETQTRNFYAQRNNPPSPGQNQSGPQQPQSAPAQGAAPDPRGGTATSPVQTPARQGPQPPSGGQPPSQPGDAVASPVNPVTEVNDSDSPKTVAGQLANHLTERGLPPDQAASAAQDVTSRPEFAGMSYEQIIAEGPKFRAALDDLGIDGSLNSKDVATNPLKIQPGSKLARVKAEMEAKAEAAKAAAAAGRDPFSVTPVNPVNEVPDFSALRQKVKDREISDTDAARQVADAVGATTPEAFIAAAQQHLGWKPLRAEVAAHLHFGTKEDSAIPLASGKRDASNRRPVSSSPPLLHSSSPSLSKSGPDISLAADPSPLRKNRAYAADKLRVLAGIKDPSKKAWARQFFTALEQSLQRHHALYDAYAVGGPARRHLDGQMTAVLEVEGKITRLIDLDAMLAQFDYLQSPQDALRATSIEEDIHAAVLQLAREKPSQYGYAALRKKWQALPAELKQTVWQAYRAANQSTASAAEATMPKLKPAQEWHMMNEFLRMLVQDAAFAGAITETVDPASGLIGWVQDLLRDLSRLLKNLMQKVQPDLRANLDRMVAQISDRLSQIEAASAAQKDRLATLPSLRDPAAYAATVLEKLGAAENAGILADAALARVFDQLDPALQSRAFALHTPGSRPPTPPLTPPPTPTPPRANKAVLLRTLLSQFLGSRRQARQFLDTLSGITDNASGSKSSNLLAKITARFQDKTTEQLLAAQSPQARQSLSRLLAATVNAIGGFDAASFVHGIAANPAAQAILQEEEPETTPTTPEATPAPTRNRRWLLAQAQRPLRPGTPPRLTPGLTPPPPAPSARQQAQALQDRQQRQDDFQKLIKEEEAANLAGHTLTTLRAELDGYEMTDDERVHYDARTAAGRQALRQVFLARQHHARLLRQQHYDQIQQALQAARGAPEWEALTRRAESLVLFARAHGLGMFVFNQGGWRFRRAADWRLAGSALENYLAALGVTLDTTAGTLSAAPDSDFTVATTRDRTAPGVLHHLILKQEALDDIATYLPATAGYLHLLIGSESDQRHRLGLTTNETPTPVNDVTPVNEVPVSPEPTFTPLAPDQSPFAANTPVSSTPPLLHSSSPSPAPTARVPLGGRNSLPAQFATAEDLAAFQYQLDREALLREGTPEKDRTAARDRITALRARLIDDTGASKEEVEQKLADYHRAVIDAAKKADPVETFRPVSFSNFLRARGTQAKADTLVAPEGGDIISALQGRVKRIGKISRAKNAGEWDWYRQMQQQVQAENGGRPLSRRQLQQAQKAALNGDVSTPLNLLQWINLNVVDTDKGMPIDEAANILADSGKLDENDPRAEQAFDVDGVSLGDAILAALDARVALRDQGGDPALRQESQALQQSADFRAVAEGAPGRAFTGSELANDSRIQRDVEIQLGTEWLTVTDVDADEGTVSLDSDRYGPQGIESGQTIHLLAIGDETFPSSSSSSSYSNSSSTSPSPTLPVSSSPPPGYSESTLAAARAELRAALQEAGLAASNRLSSTEKQRIIASIYAHNEDENWGTRISNEYQGGNAWLTPDNRYFHNEQHWFMLPDDTDYTKAMQAGFVRLSFERGTDKTLWAEFYPPLSTKKIERLRTEALMKGAELQLDPDRTQTLAASNRSPAFDRWFGDSKVVTRSGTPLVVYHRTDADFDTFDPTLGETGIHLATDRDQLRGMRGKRTLALYARITNPLRIMDRGVNNPTSLTYEAHRLGVITKAQRDQITNPPLTYPAWKEQNPQGTYEEYNDRSYYPAMFEKLRELVEAAGHDGFVYTNRYETTVDSRKLPSYIALRPEQVKSATDNSGAFDPESPSFLAASPRVIYAKDLPVTLRDPQFIQGGTGEGGAYPNTTAKERIAAAEAEGRVEVPAGGHGSLMVWPDEAEFIETHGYGRTHLNSYALAVYQSAKAGSADGMQYHADNLVAEFTSELGEDETTARNDANRLMQAAQQMVGGNEQGGKGRPPGAAPDPTSSPKQSGYLPASSLAASNRLSDRLTPAIRINGVLYTDGVTHWDIMESYVWRHKIPAWQRNETEDRQLARDWIEKNWKDFHSTVEEGFAEDGKFLPREAAFKKLLRSPEGPALKQYVKDSGGAGRTWLDSGDLDYLAGLSQSPPLPSSPRIRAAAATYADNVFHVEAKRSFPDFLAYVQQDFPDSFDALKTPHLRSAWNTVMAEKGLPEITPQQEAAALRPYTPKVERRFGEPPADLARKLAALDADDMGFPIALTEGPADTPVRPVSTENSEPGTENNQADFWGTSFDDYRLETRPVPDGSPMTANAIKAIAPYLISGNKGDLLGRHGTFYLSLVKPAPVVLDAFGGAAIYTHFLAQQGALPAGSTWNEWEYSRSITNRQIKEQPAAVVRELISLREGFDTAFPVTEIQPTYEATMDQRRKIHAWINQKLEDYLPAQERDSMGRFPLPDTPQTAALYLFLQNNMAENRVVDFDLSEDGKPRSFTGGKMNGKDDFSFIFWDNPSNAMKHNRPSRVWGADMPVLIRDASRRFAHATVRQGDGWQIATDAPAGALVFVDTSYFPTDEQTAAGAAVMNYGNTTLGDANPALWFQKFEKYLLPKGQDVRYVVTNNFNGRVVDQLEKAGWTVLRTFRGSPKKPSHEFIALSPAAVADLRLQSAPARRYGPGGIPLGDSDGPFQTQSGGAAEDQRRLSAGEPRQTGKRDPQSGLYTPALDRTLEQAPGQATNALERAEQNRDLDADLRAAKEFDRDLMATPEIELADLEAQIQDDYERYSSDPSETSDEALPAAPRHPATGQPLPAARRQPAGPTYPGLKKPTLPAPTPRPELFGEWSADIGTGQNWRSQATTNLIGFRGVITPGKDNGFGNTEGNGIYLMRKQQEAAVFGKVQRISFPEPQRPFLVTNDDLYLLHESEELDQPIDPVKDSPWLQASKYAAQHAHNLGNGKWSQELAGDILTKLLMEAGYDSVYVQGMPDDWIVLLRETRTGQKPLAALKASNRVLPPKPDLDNYATHKGTQEERRAQWDKWHSDVDAWNERVNQFAARQGDLGTFLAAETTNSRGGVYREARVITRVPGSSTDWRTTIFGQQRITPTSTPVGDWANNAWVPIAHDEFPTKGEAYQSAMRSMPEDYTFSTKPLFASNRRVEYVEPGFYSALAEAIRAKMPARSTPATILGILHNAGLKAEEIKWTGIKNWLQAQAQDGPITQQQVLDYLATEGSVKFTLTRLDANKFGDAYNPDIVRRLDEATRARRIWREDATNVYGETRDEWPREMHQQLSAHNTLVNDLISERDADAQNRLTRNTQWTLPGGTNPKEVVVTWKQAPTAAELAPGQAAKMSRQDLIQWYRTTIYDDIAIDATEQDVSTERLRELYVSNVNLREQNKKPSWDNRISPNDYTDTTHYGDLDALAWYRTTDRTNASGDGTLVEEFQSKWHQQGREKGYRDQDQIPQLQEEIRAASKALTKAESDASDALRRDDLKNYRSQYLPRLEEADALHNTLSRKLLELQNGIPDAPYRTAWPLMLFKRALLDAVQSGKQWIGWTNGDTQADRYDLSKKIKTVRYYWDGPADPHGQLLALNHEGQTVLNERKVTPDKLAEYIGKEPAEKLLTAPNQQGMRELSGLDLKVGGQGMRKFYDEMLVKEFGKYVKQLGGGTVESSEVNSSTKEYKDPVFDIPQAEQDRILAEAHAAIDREHPDLENDSDDYMDFVQERVTDLSNEWAQKHGVKPTTTPIHLIRITPEMRSAVTAGQALFAAPRMAADDDTRFYNLTSSLPDQMTAKDIERFKAEQPEKYAELARLRETALRRAGFDVLGYHGTSSDFDTFDLERSASNTGDHGIWATGFHFAPDPKVAQRYGPKLLKTFLRLKNPATINDGFSQGIEDIPQEFWDAHTKNTRAILSRIFAAKNIPSNFIETMSIDEDFTVALSDAIGLAGYLKPSRTDAPKTARRALMQAGYDGVIAKAIYDADAPAKTEYIVFDPGQIKSADPLSPGSKIPPSQWGDETNPSTLFAAPRRARESMTFDPPFHTAFGDILSYDWMSQSVGGMESQRISDWSAARTNPATGREIVHHFKVRKPDGIHTVSLETALGQLSIPQRSKLQGLIKAEQERRKDQANGQMALFSAHRQFAPAIRFEGLAASDRTRTETIEATGLAPAISVNNTAYTGQPGMLHPSILGDYVWRKVFTPQQRRDDPNQENAITHAYNTWMDARGSGFDDFGFLDTRTGKFLTREEAYTLLTERGFTPPAGSYSLRHESLDSHDLFNSQPTGPLPAAQRNPRLAAWQNVPGKGDPESLETGYISGKHNDTIARRATERGDIGLLVTPLIPSYLAHAAKYPFVAIDNGVFSKATPFSPDNFRALVERVAKTPDVKPNVLFVVAPDVVGDAARTLDQFGEWADYIHSRDLPAALAAQDGLEDLRARIPWNQVDVLFIGGSTEWKTGQLPPSKRAAWAEIFMEAHRRGIPIHMGRVNTNDRIAGIAQIVGASTVDGTYLAFGPDKNLPKLEAMLDELNVHGRDLGAQRFPELGRYPSEGELYDLAFDEEVTSTDGLGAYEPAAKEINAIRVAHGLPSLQGRRDNAQMELALWASPRLPGSFSPSLATDVAAAAAATDPNPTDAQKRAGNYAKGKVDLHGLRISIENPAGSVRSGTEANGKPWSVTLPHHYGYILGSEGRDGDHVDVFIGPNPDSQLVLIVNQRKPGNGHFDEHKVMLGFNTPAEAARGYMASYSPGWKGLQSAVPTTLPVFYHWLTTHDTTLPVTKEQIDKLAKTVPLPTSAHDKPAVSIDTTTKPKPAHPPVTHTLPDGYHLTGPGLHTILPASIRAHHGTPHKIPLTEGFSLSKVGTGEGVQAYGWGLYFAQSEDIAAHYADKLSPSARYLYDGVEVPPYDEITPENMLTRDPRELLGAAIKWGAGFQFTQSSDERAESMIRWARSHNGRKPLPLEVEDRLEEIGRAFDPGKLKSAKGNLYTVELLGDPDAFLDWDKPLSEQSEKVKEAIERNAIALALRQKHGGNVTGQDILEEAANTPQGRSRRLLAAGIPGIRYLDGGSRASGNGTYNYVLFDDKLVKIVEQNGKPISQSPSLPLSSSPPLAASSRAPLSRRILDRAKALDRRLLTVPGAAQSLDLAGRATDLTGQAITQSAAAVATGTERTLQVANTLTESLGIQQPLATFGSNNLDKRLAAQLDKLAGPKVRSAKAAVETWLDKPEGLAPTIKGLVDQVLPTALIPREWLALHHEMQRKTAYGQETANDLIRALSGNPRLSDLAYPKEFAENPAARAQLFDAMEGRIPMATLPPAMQRLGQRLRDLLRQTGSELVRQGLMNPDTFEELQSNGWMPRYTEDEARESAGSFLAAFKLGVRDLLQQRSTAYHIVDTTRKDKTGQFVTVSRDEGGKRNRWRFRDAASRDAFYHKLIRQHALAALQEDNKHPHTKTLLDALDAKTRREVRADIKKLTLDEMELTAKVSPAVARLIKSSLHVQADRFAPKDPFEPAKLVKDPVYAVARYVLGQTHNAATMELLRKTAQHPEWVSDVAITGFTAIPDASRFGPLAGKHVRKDIAAQILDLVDVPNAALQFYDAILRKWKAGKLVWNLGSHIRDAVGNTMFAFLGGSSIWNPGNWPHYQQAIAALRSGGADFAEMIEQQVIGGDAYTGLVKERLKGILPDPKTVENYDPGFVQRLLFGFGARLHGSHEFLAGIRRLPDDLFKAAAYFKAKADLASDPNLKLETLNSSAAQHVRKWFPYYDRLGQSGTTRAVGRFVNPFVSFFRESTRILGTAVVERPLALTAALSFPAIITALSAMMLGLDDDDLEEIQKDMAGKGKLFATGTSLFSMLLPFRSAQGAVQQFDISAIMPFADLLGTRVVVTDATEDPWNRFWRGIVSGGPVLSLVDAWRHNEDAFTRRPIAEFGMTPLEKITAYTRHAAGVALPPLAPGGTAFNTLLRAGDRATNKTLETYDPAQAFTRAVVGLNVKNATPDLYRLADDWRKAHGYEVTEGMDYGSTTPASRARKALFGVLAQDDPNPAAIQNILRSLDAMGHPVRTEQDINRLLFYRDPIKLIGGNKAKGISPADAQAQFRASLQGEARQALERALQEYQRIKARAPSLIRSASSS